MSRRSSFPSLADDVQQMVQRLTISQEHGVSLLRLPDHAMQSRLAQAVVDHDLSLKQTKALVGIWIAQGKEAVGVMLGLTELWTRKSDPGHSETLDDKQRWEGEGGRIS